MPIENLAENSTVLMDEEYKKPKLSFSGIFGGQLNRHSVCQGEPQKRASTKICKEHEMSKDNDL